MTIGLLDYGMGNIASVVNVLEYLGFDYEVVDQAAQLDGIEKLIVPGVGAFGVAMNNLKEKGLDQAILRHVEQGRDYLGICLGMQLLATKGYEHGEHDGLDIISGEVKPLEVVPLAVPHVGWNDMRLICDHPVVGKNLDGSDVYFVHSYHFVPQDNSSVVTVTGYGNEFISTVAKGNVLGVQFHPEKSHEAGLSIIENFCEGE